MLKRIKQLFNKIPKEYYKYSCLLVLLIPCFMSNITFAKYVFEDVNEKYLISKNFYFNSPQLNEGSYTTHDWDGVSEYDLQFDIENFADELRWTEENLTYEISVTCDPSIPGDVVCDGDDGTIMYNNLTPTTNNIIIKLTNPNDLAFSMNDYVDMSISVRSTHPYRKTLTANFRIYVTTRLFDYSVYDEVNRDYLELYISNRGLNNDTINVVWDPLEITVDNLRRVIFEADQSILTINGINYVNGFTTTVNTKSSFKVRYYKTDPTQDYTCENATCEDIFTLTHQ